MAATKKTANSNATFDPTATMNPEAFKEGYEKFAEGVSSFAEFNKGSIDAMMASAGALSKGMERFASEQSSFMKTAFEESVASAKAASGAKSVQEAFDIHSEFARETFEKNLGQANKVAEIMIDTTKQTVEPLTTRYSEMVEKIQSFRP